MASTTITLEFSPELKQAFDELNAKLDTVIERLNSASDVQVKLCGADLVALGNLTNYRAKRTQ